jgi:serine/threonine protein kinase
MMTTSLACPDETELLVLAMGEPVAAALKAHVDGCAACQTRLARLHAEVAILRQNHECETPPSTELDPALEHDAEQPYTETTRDWTPPEPSGSPGGPARPGPEAVAAARELAEGLGSMPDAIGRYKVVGQLGSGGEADVYRVVHIKLGNDLVLKLSRRQVGSDNQSGLIDEGRLLIDLQHPNLVRIYDLDFHDNRPFLVMEYVHGRNLEDYARDEPVSARRAAVLVGKLAEVMRVAHQHGITHCDIKPKNILIDKLGEPRLIDFGMARMRHAWSDRVDSSVGGTVAYMAPEQARLELDRIGPRSDIFALGGVLYFLLTGSAPFQGQTHEEVWDRARRCDFEPGALRAAKVPRRLEQICLKAMAAEPAGRYATAEALGKALKSYVRRHRLVAASALILLIPAVAFGAWSLRRPPAGSPSSPAPFPHPAPAPAALTGELTVRVWSEGGERKRGLRVEEPGALPLLPGEQVHLEAHISQPAYLYLLWLDGQGQVSVLYPRQDGRFGSSPSGGTARDTVHSPEALDRGLRMKGPGGLETALLLVRRKPLAPNIDLTALIGPLPKSPLRNELEVAVRGFNEGQPVESLMALNRGIDDVETAKIDDPLLQLMEKLRSQNQFDVIKAVRFAYRGE